MRAHAPPLLVLLFSACAVPTARGTPFDVVNDLRTGGCASQRAAPLHRSPTLDEVAGRIARGATLAVALADTGYRALSSTYLRITGPRSDREMAALLRAHHCRRIADPAFGEAGTWRHGDSTWIVLAAPSPLPSAGDAARLGREVLALVNAARTAARRCGQEELPAAPPLVAEARLAAAALAYARELARLERFAHEGADGSTAAVRVDRAGYRHRIVGENLAAGPTSAGEVVAGWLASPGHCANLMDARFTQMGIGYAISASRQREVYWVQLLAAPR